MKSESEVALLCLTPCDPGKVAYQALPSMGFSRQEYWSGRPFPFPGDHLNPGIEPGSPAWKIDALPSEPLETLTIIGWIYVVNTRLWSFKFKGSSMLGMVKSY